VDPEAAVVTVWDLLSGAVRETPARAIVVDDASGFWHGISAAEYLAERGASVELLTTARGVGLGLPPESVAGALRRLRGNGVRFRPFAGVRAVHATSASCADSITGEPFEVDADLVVVRTQLRVNDGIAHELEAKVPALAIVGDCASPRRITHAILEANLVLRQFDAGTLSPVPMALF